MNFVSTLLKEITKVHKPSVVYKDNQVSIFLANNSQVVMRTKHIGIRHQFMTDMIDGKYIGIKYIRIEEKPADIMTKNGSESDYMKYMSRIIEGELW